MPHIVNIPLEDGESLRVEVDGRREDGGWAQVGRTQDAVQTVGRTLQEALAPMRPAMQAVVAQLRGGIAPPDRISLEFGIKVSADAGIVVARTATEANFSVSVEWNRPAAGEAGTSGEAG